MPRPKNPRRELLALLKPTRDRLKWLHDHWTWQGRSTVWGEHNSSSTRPRRPEEYPENQAQEWLSAYAHVNEAIAELVEVREFIKAQYAERMKEPA